MILRKLESRRLFSLPYHTSIVFCKPSNRGKLGKTVPRISSAAPQRRLFLKLEIICLFSAHLLEIRYCKSVNAGLWAQTGCTVNNKTGVTIFYPCQLMMIFQFCVELIARINQLFIIGEKVAHHLFISHPTSTCSLQ